MKDINSLTWTHDKSQKINLDLRQATIKDCEFLYLYLGLITIYDPDRKEIIRQETPEHLFHIRFQDFLI